MFILLNPEIVGESDEYVLLKIRGCENSTNSLNITTNYH